ncbi:hypothetical protein ACPWSR_04490 [Alloiococcus sp. CFN-8]|uniref:hypothetical protein n=1 Tax=Alloiococcus sp. CFN-8 TaxID=3416081 RepID=UPI003CEC5DEF
MGWEPIGERAKSKKQKIKDKSRERRACFWGVRGRPGRGLFFCWGRSMMEGLSSGEVYCVWGELVRRGRFIVFVVVRVV